jgi:hypothetical protein
VDVALITTVVGTVAAVVAVPVALLQLRQGRKKSVAGSAEQPNDRGPGIPERARDVLPCPAGRLPVHVRGRDDVIADLAGLAERPDGQVQVLAGLGGSSKSTVALSSG